MGQPEIYTRKASHIWLGEDGVIRKVFLEGAEEDIEEAYACVAIIKRLCDGVKRPLLVDFSKVRNLDPDVRALYAKDDIAHLLSAVAGITSSRLSKVIGNFFIGFNRPTTPNRLFNSEEEAILWLKEYV